MCFYIEFESLKIFLRTKVISEQRIFFTKYTLKIISKIGLMGTKPTNVR